MMCSVTVERTGQVALARLLFLSTRLCHNLWTVGSVYRLLHGGFGPIVACMSARMGVHVGIPIWQ